MNPKDKAKELLDLISNHIDKENAILCLKIFINQMIQEVSKSCDFTQMGERVNFWLEVKVEIEKL